MPATAIASRQNNAMSAPGPSSPPSKEQMPNNGTRGTAVLPVEQAGSRMVGLLRAAQGAAMVAPLVRLAFEALLRHQTGSPERLDAVRAVVVAHPDRDAYR